MSFFPLSQPQQRIWFGELQNPNTQLHNISFTGLAPIEASKVAISQAWNQIVALNEGLRLQIADLTEGQLQQYVSPFKTAVPPILTFAQFSQAEDWMREETQRPFVLTNSPLYRFFLLDIAEEKGIRYFIAVHHVISDGGSINRIPVWLHQGLTNPDKLKANRSYQGFVAAEAHYLNSPEADEHLAYWRSKLNTPPEPIQLGSATGSGTPFYATRWLPEALFARMRQQVEQQGISLYTWLMTALGIYVARVSNQSCVAVGMAHHNRVGPHFKRSFGMYANTFPFFFQYHPESSLIEHARKATKQLKQSMAGPARFPFNRLVSELRQSQDVDINHITRLNLVGQFNQPHDYQIISPGLNPEGLTIHVNVNGRAKKGLLELGFAGDGKTFTQDDVTPLFSALCALLTAGLSSPALPASGLPMVDQEQQQRLLAFNPPSVPYPAQYSVIDAFKNIVAKHPQKTAVIAGSNTLDFGTLDARSEQIASALIKANQNKPLHGCFIGICLPRSAEMITAILGVLKAGGAYVPLDPQYPAKRIGFMLQDAKIKLALATPEVAPLLPNVTIINPCAALNMPAQHINSCARADDYAYAIYTSGTTGNPKAVPIKHTQVIQLVYSFSKTAGIHSASRSLLFASLNFDASVAELFPTLLTGATLVVALEEHRRDARALSRLLKDERINCATIPPALLAIMPQTPLPDLTDLIVAGESTDSGVIERWSQNRRMINAYGPTENTVAATAGLLTVNGNPRDIGKPRSGTYCYVLDKQLELVAPEHFQAVRMRYHATTAIWLGSEPDLD